MTAFQGVICGELVSLENFKGGMNWSADRGGIWRGHGGHPLPVLCDYLEAISISPLLQGALGSWPASQVSGQVPGVRCCSSFPATGWDALHWSFYLAAPCCLSFWHLGMGGLGKSVVVKEKGDFLLVEDSLCSIWDSRHSFGRNKGFWLRFSWPALLCTETIATNHPTAFCWSSSFSL